MENEKTSRICVTGAGGFIASWVVKLFLSKGYLVHGTVRDLGEEKTAHLRKLDGASQNLQLFKADLLDYDSLLRAITGCVGVLHVATPVPSSKVSVHPEIEYLETAVNGTLNVLRACTEAKVKKVINVSSIAAVLENPNLPKIADEDCWSDEDYCRTAPFFLFQLNWYFISKTAAEKKALEYGDKEGINVISICPSYTFGPTLQSTINSSNLVLLRLMEGIFLKRLLVYENWQALTAKNCQCPLELPYFIDEMFLHEKAMQYLREICKLLSTQGKVKKQNMIASKQVTH